MSQKIWTKDGKVVVDANGNPILCEECPCVDPCAEMIEELRQEAAAGGYALLGEGIVVVKTYSYSPETGEYTFHPWYHPWVVKKFRAAYETPTQIVGVLCDLDSGRCQRGTIDKAWGGCSDYRIYLQMPDACSCIDRREIFLAYPEVFGVQSVTYGDDAIFDCVAHGSQDHFYWACCEEFPTVCDYRRCFIVSKWANSMSPAEDILCIWMVSASGPSEAYTIKIGLSSATYTGMRRQLFTDGQQGFSKPCVGHTYRAYNESAQYGELYSTREMAQESADRIVDYSYRRADGTAVATETVLRRFPTPDLGESYFYQGFVEQRGDAWYGYTGSFGRRLSNSQSTNEESRDVYCEQYILTNLGILTRDGNMGTTLHICGSDELPGYNASWRSFDATTEIDTDMHWCHPDLFGEDVP